MVKNKKGSGMMDVYVIFIFFFIVTLAGGISIFLMGEINDGLQDVDELPQIAKTASSGFNDLLSSVMDGAIILWIAILWIGSLVTAWFLDNSPVFFIIFFLLGIFSFFGLVPFSNVMSEMFNSSLSTAFNQMPMAMFISNYVAAFIAVYLISVGVVLYMKQKQGVGAYA